MNVRAGQVWRFARGCGLQGDCEIEHVDGYGAITGKYFDSIGTPCLGTVKEEDLDYLVAEEAPGQEEEDRIDDA